MHLPTNALVFVLVSATSAAAADNAVVTNAEAVMRKSFSSASPDDWNARLKQDEVQALCSRYRNHPPPKIARQILASQQRTLRYPPGGKMIGDWREGEKLAFIGTGGQSSTIRPEAPGTPRGGNCYACHTLAPSEVAAGNLGPSLTGFGKLRGTSPDAVKRTYEQIFNVQAFYPCSMMPRFGHNGWLTPEQIADAVAFLLDPESPVNK
jgi:sulfur-oxidizing protein SoxX